MEIGSKQWSDLIIDSAAGFQLELDQHHVNQFAVHAVELLQWTQKVNITTIRDPIEIAVKHFLDSLMPVGMMPEGAMLLDIGSGGGFPGIPLKVIIPSLSVTLIDASRKKVSFLKHVIRSLKLDKIQALHCRAEDLGDHPSYRCGFDVIISRAVTSLDFFVRLALPLLAEQGTIIALKGHTKQEDLDELQSKNTEKIDCPNSVRGTLTASMLTYNLPLVNSKRSIISIRKQLP
jgi:16S rRNA (guanine527-N7)-methyltransferase